MSCRHLTKHARPASLLHRAFCADCRKALRADSIISFALLCRKSEPVPLDGMGRMLAALELPYSIPRPRRERVARFLRRVRRPVGILAAGSALLGYAWIRYIDIEPDVVIPATSINGPNAFDDFTMAASKLMNGKTIDDMQTQVAKQRKEARLAAEKAASTDSRAANDAPAAQAAPPPSGVGMMSGGMMSGGEAGMPGMGASPDEHIFTLEERDATLRLNEPALNSLRRGLTHSYLAPRVRSFDQTLPYLADFRKLARLVRLEADTLADHGQWDRSVNASIDAIDLGMHVRQNGPLIENLVGQACEAIGRSGLWDAIDHLSASEARQAASRLETIEAARYPIAGMMAEEKWSMIAGTMDMMRKPGWRTLAFGNSDQMTNYWAYFALLPYSKTRIVTLEAEHMDRIISDLQSPYWNLQAALNDGQFNDYPPILQMIMPVFSQCKFREFCDQAQNRMLIVALALRAYRAEHGSYPKTLSLLLPEYLKELPRDPFSYTNGLRYRLDGAKYVLWSVGPDGNDQNGIAIEDRSQGSAMTRTVTTSSSGDIVAGINVN